MVILRAMSVATRSTEKPWRCSGHASLEEGVFHTTLHGAIKISLYLWMGSPNSYRNIRVFWWLAQQRSHPDILEEKNLKAPGECTWITVD